MAASGATSGGGDEMDETVWSASSEDDFAVYDDEGEEDEEDGEVGMEEMMMMDGLEGLSEEELAREALLDELYDKADELYRKAVKEPEVYSMEDAVRVYEEIIEAGAPDAYNILGEIYLLGDGVPSNYTLAAELFDKGADYGIPECQHNRAFMYQLGLGGPKNVAKAALFEYFAATGGSNAARMALGYRHLHGLGVPKSCDVAAKYYSKVAEEVVRELTDEDGPATVIEKMRLSNERNRLESPDKDPDVIQYYKHSAEHGDANAQVALGHLHYYGAQGVPQDSQRAAQYFQAAADQGDSGAMSSLGQMYVQGEGVEQNNDTARELFERAAKKGDPAGQNGLGYIYLHGRGVPKDYKKALRNFRLAAEQGHADAQFNLGVLYFTGTGVKKSYQSALQYFTHAAESGHTRAVFNLGQMHLFGLGTPPVCAIGVKYLKGVAERGSWVHVLGDAHRSYIEGDPEYAALLYARSAEEGLEVAQSNSAFMMDWTSNSAWLPEESVVRQDGFDPLQVARRHYELAAGQGNVEAQRILGDFAYYGWGAENQKPNYRHAAKRYTRGADSNDAQSMFNLGYMHQYGIGLPKDFHLAKRYYDLAKDASPDAFVPAQLALATLVLQRAMGDYFPNWFGPPDGAVPVRPAKKQAEREEESHAQEEQVADAIMRTASSVYEGAAAQLDAAWAWWNAKLPNSEDQLLAVLCAALAVVLVLRARQQPRRPDAV